MNTRNRESKQKKSNSKLSEPNLSLKTYFCCPYCLKWKKISLSGSVEHEPPLSRQEELRKESKEILACKQCNNEKSALTAPEYSLWKQLKQKEILSDAERAEFLRLEALRNGCAKQK